MKTKTQFSNRILSLMLAFVMVVSMLPLNMLTASAATEGTSCESTDGCSGTYENGFCTECDGYQPARLQNGLYFISNGGQLYWFAAFVNASQDNQIASAYLEKDIVVNEQVLDANGDLISNASSLRTWTPIANGDYSFRGTFNGNGFTISGLYCKQQGNYSRAGLFNSTMYAYIRDVIILDSYFEAYYCAGAIVAYSMSTNISHCYSEATVMSAKEAGGIAGYSCNDYILQCGNAGKVSGSDPLCGVGGIVGLGEDMYNSSSPTILRMCYNIGKVTNTGSGTIYYTGALVGDPMNTDIAHCYYDASKCSNAIGSTYSVTDGQNYDNCTLSNVVSKTTAEFANGTVCELVETHVDIWDCTADAHKKQCRICGADTLSESVHTLKQNCENGGDCTICGYTVAPGTSHRFSGNTCSVCGHVCTSHSFGTDGNCITCEYQMVPVTDIQYAVYSQTQTLVQGEKLSLTSGVSVLPNNAQFQTVTWYTVENGIETAVEDGTVTASKVGTLTLRAKIENGSAMGQTFTKDFTFTVTPIDCEYNIAQSSVAIDKYDDNNLQITYDSSSVVVSKDTPIRIYGETTSTNRVTVAEGVSVNLVLDNCKITGNNGNFSPIEILSGAQVQITLVGDNELHGYRYRAALYVSEGAAVTIGGIGSLKAVGGTSGNGAGIGGSDASRPSGDITINSGTVTAISYGGAAAIGASRTGSMGKITINGGTVTATNYDYDSMGAAGIGLHTGSGGEILITGGTVTATGGIKAAGIGSGQRSTAPNVTITGGTVMAYGSDIAYGIGPGWLGTEGTTTITGGNVYATGQRGSIGGTVVNSSTEALSLYTLTLTGANGDSVDDAVTELVGVTGYGLQNVVPIDSKLYFYLPSGSEPTCVVSGNVNYLGAVADGAGTFVYEHICVATATTVTCMTLAVCDICGKDIGVLNPDTHESSTYTYTADETAPTALHAVRYACCGAVKETVLHTMENGICKVCDYYQMPQSSEGVYLISNAGQLLQFKTIVEAGNKSANAKLIADIDMTGIAWSAMCSTDGYWDTSEYSDAGYQGTFDGDGHVIKNITIESGGNVTAGLFGTLSGSVKHLGLENVTVDSSDMHRDTALGTITGQILGGEISDCYVKTVNSSSSAANLPLNLRMGGIAGLNFGGTINNCYVSDYGITGGYRYGGIVVYNKGMESDSTRIGTINNCYTDSSTISHSTYPGNVTNCTTGISAETFASGEVAYALGSAWGQTLGEQDYPVLDGEKVYQITDCKGNTAYSNTDVSGVHSYNGTTHACIYCGIIDPSYAGADQIKWQITAGSTAEDATTNLRLISYVDTLENYAKVVFTISFADADGNTRTADLTCTTVYEQIKADGMLIESAESLFGAGATYFVTFTIENWQQAYYDTEITVTVTRYDLESNVDSTATRVIVVSAAM